MIRQNIVIAICTILGFLGLWAIACAFIKIDVSTTSIINMNNEMSILSMENKEASYIENHNISKVKIEYDKQYFTCQITFESRTDHYTNYYVFLPPIIPKSESIIVANTIITTLNVYDYILKK